MNRFATNNRETEDRSLSDPLLSEQSVVNGIVCAGVPLRESKHNEQSDTMSTSHRTASNRRGFSAFALGVVLSVFAWVSNQGWTILSLFLFGPFQWSFETAWKHLLFCTVGSLCTSIAWCRAFGYIFPEEPEDDDDDEDEDDDGDKSKQRRKDVFDALQELGELGFVAGYLATQYVGTMLFNQANLIITYERSNTFDGAVMVLLILWVLCAKVKDYKKAVKRAYVSESKDVVTNAYVQIV